MTTNREYLATLSSEELAELFNVDGLCNLCIHYGIICINKDCYEGTLQWLNAEREEE